MTLVDNAQPSSSATARGAKRNFILQQGLCDPSVDVCSKQYSALLFQPRVIAMWVVAATVFQFAPAFFALAAVLWWNAILPRFNPFDAIYNATFARPGGPRLAPAPGPRRFAQVIAGTFAVAIAICLTMHWRIAAYVFEAFILLALSMLIFGRFCLGSFLYHIVRGQTAFATRTLPWAKAT